MRLRNRIKRLYKETKIYYDAIGWRGILAISENLICRHPEQLILQTKGLKHPLYLRIQTSDAEVYEDTFVKQEYNYPVSFSPRTIVDVGANCGMTSVFYANQFPQATIIALEPEISNFEALVRNTCAYPNVRPIRAALWKEDGQVELFSGWPRTTKWGKWGFRVRNGSGCRALTLRSLMREVAIESIDILKIDVEGAEREIFLNCDWMEAVQFLAIELHDRFWPGCSDPVNAATTCYHKVESGPLTFYARRIDPGTSSDVVQPANL